ncbi:MAG: DUF3226 domain-containing protein [Phocaeicola sp.]
MEKSLHPIEHLTNYRIFVEGVADKQFISEYLIHLGSPPADLEKIIVDCKGWRSIYSESIRTALIQNSNNGGSNLVIFDADSDFEKRKSELERWREETDGVDFHLFLFPNHQDKGDLENLLEQIIPQQNQMILGCWKKYEEELSNLEIAGRTPPPLTTPAKKTMIYGYLEALLLPSEKELIKEKKRAYRNKLHWNLDATGLEKLRAFLIEYLK